MLRLHVQRRPGDKPRPREIVAIVPSVAAVGRSFHHGGPIAPLGRIGQNRVTKGLPEMHGQAFENLVQELSNLSSTRTLPPDWIICTDSDLFRDLRTMAERQKWLKKAKAELTRRLIQERVDEIAEAWEGEDASMVEVLLEAFPKDLEVYKGILSPSHLQKWIDKASLAACGCLNECERINLLSIL
jgi:hypothetical protein